jgi:hypothetical protein
MDRSRVVVVLVLPLGCGPDRAQVDDAGEATTVEGETTVGESDSSGAAAESSGSTSSSDGSADTSTGGTGAPACGGTLAYELGASVEAGYNPQGLRLADTNGDGALDLLVALGGQDAVAYFTGDGSGGFTHVDDLATGTIPADLATGDFDGDAHLDFVVAQRDDFDITAYFGDGAGAFAGPTAIPNMGRSESVAVADLDSDGHLDLVSTENEVKLHYGADGGTFGGALSFPTPPDARDVAVLDLDGDDALDVITSSWTDRQIVILRGDGSGGLAPSETFQTTLAISTFAVADLDADGAIDVAFAGRTVEGATEPYAAALGIARGDGSGGFDQPMVQDLGKSPASMIAADLDADGDLDLAVTDLGVFTTGDAGAVRVAWGTGDGTFASIDELTAGANPSGLDAADLDGDGLLELVVSNNGGTDVTVLHATCAS